jgi:alpha-ketoglutarate-dependent taurine dioxygenase
MDRLAAERRFRLEMNLERGDMQFVNNSAILHSRTEYEDNPVKARKRHLLRLWLDSSAFMEYPTASTARHR